MSGIYKTFLYKYLTPKYEYKITKITKYKDVYDILLEPITSNNNFKFTSGQYVYLSFLTESKKISTESHPFCIASASFENTLRFTIKQLGDFTSNLDELKIDDKAIMRGPHGEIGERFSGSNEQNKDAIFIGGGIGIAPFLSLFKTASIEKTIRKTTLFHCTKYKKEAYFDDELKNLAKNNEKLKYFSHSSHKQGHLQAKKILNQITDKENTIVYLCGPNTMMSNLSNELIKNKFNKNNIVLEDFEIF